MTLSPIQSTRLNTQLSQVVKQINAGELKVAGIMITQLVRKHPANAHVNHVASGFYAHSHQSDRAIYYANHAAKIDPTNASYQVALGVLFVQASMYEKAIKSLEKALDIDPKTPQLKGALGVSYSQTGRLRQARDMFNQAIELSADDFESGMNLALLESDIGNAKRAVSIMRSVIGRFPDNPILHDSLCMFASYDDELTPKEVFDIHHAFGQCVSKRVRKPNVYSNTIDPNKRIRIGFVSPDLKEHSVAYFVEPIFDNLNRSKFELYIYHTSSHSDHVSARFEKSADVWRNCTQGIAQSHKQIVEDKIDVLIELTGHFASNLLPIFAAKPTPISISTIGYANTTGLDSIDARIIDEITDPSPESDEFATEKLIRMPGCFLCYRPPKISPSIEVSDSDRPFTFGSFNDLRKISPSTLDVWAKILIANSDTKLMLKSSRFGDKQVCSEFIARFEERGVQPDRLILKGRTESLQDHLAMYNQIDCALDTFPYAGTTTTCEAIWMGVPVLTLLGETHAGRVGASLLNAIGEADDIALTRENYIENASEKANMGKPSLNDRVLLRGQMQDSLLCDEKAYALKFENIMQALWESWCQSKGVQK